MTTEVGGNLPKKTSAVLDVTQHMSLSLLFHQGHGVVFSTADKALWLHSPQYEGSAALESAFAGGCSKYELYWSR